MFWNILDKFTRWSLIICNLSIMMIVVAAVVMRYALELNFYGSEEILMIFAFWLYFLGASYGSYEKSHVEADFINAWLGDVPFTRVLGYIRDVVEIIVLVVLTYWSVLFILFAFDRWPVTPGWKIPLLVPQSAILVGFVIMTLHAVKHFYLKVTGNDSNSVKGS